MRRRRAGAHARGGRFAPALSAFERDSARRLEEEAPTRASIHTGFEVCVVVPTRNEAGNVAPLLDRLRPVLAGSKAEILFVDDSTDETPEVVAEIIRDAGRRRESATAQPAPMIRLLHRPAGERAGGLGGAVTLGVGSTDADVVVVMDGDLQHPPELVADLRRAMQDTGADLVIASRYCGEGSADGLSSRFRGLVSSSSTVVTRAIFPRALASVTDPMSGFFAVRRSSVAWSELQPRGFKILLEILARNASHRVAEVPFEFATRHAGESKASWREGLRFLRQLLALRLTTAGAVGRFLRFGAVGASGVVVNLVALALLLQGARLASDLGEVAGSEVLCAIAASQVAVAWNFLLSERWVFRGSDGSWWRRVLPYAGLSDLTLLLQLPLTAWAVLNIGLSYMSATAVVILALSVLRFVVCDCLLFRARPRAARTARSGSTSRVGAARQRDGREPARRHRRFQTAQTRAS